jgi:hypothetical protein
MYVLFPCHPVDFQLDRSSFQPFIFSQPALFFSHSKSANSSPIFSQTPSEHVPIGPSQPGWRSGDLLFCSRRRGS